jgi:serine/threonine-protein kinase
MRDTHVGRLLPAVVDSYPVDESPYGGRGLGGNMRDWCTDVWTRDGAEVVGDRVAPPDGVDGDSRVNRGGGWDDAHGYLRAANRSRNPPWNRNASLGFHLARSIR